MNSFSFDPTAYGEACAGLLSQEHLPALGPGEARRSVGDRLHSLTLEQLFPDATIRDRSMASGCLAGLWLWFDYLTESHEVSQRISSTTGSYWHGIMHRREPDYPNAKYWFDRVGEHPVFNPLAEGTTELLHESGALEAPDVLSADGRWDPYRFVDLCRQHSGTSTDAEMLCRRIACLEWQLLFDHSYRQATGQ